MTRAQGLASQSIAPLFDRLTAMDPSGDMLQAAKDSKKVKTKSGQEVDFRLGGAESLDFLPDNSVDLICAATAGLSYVLLLQQLDSDMCRCMRITLQLTGSQHPGGVVPSASWSRTARWPSSPTGATTFVSAQWLHTSRRAPELTKSANSHGRRR